MTDIHDLPLDDRVLTVLARRRNFTTRAIRLLMRTREQLSIALGLVLVKLRDSAEPLQSVLAGLQEHQIRVQQLTEENGYLRSRLSRIPPKERSHYKLDERYRILLYKSTHLLSVEETARRLLVAPKTIARWLAEAETEPDKKTVGSLLKATPPCRSYTDVVKELVKVMDRFGFGGSKRIAQTLARAGLKLSKETVRRWRKRARPSGEPVTKQAKFKTVRADYVNHVWMMDITNIRGLFKLIGFRLVVVLDVFSRFPLIARLFVSEPSAKDVTQLFQRAVKAYGKPKHFVSDHGAQFTAHAFSRALAKQGVKQRFGAIGKTGSIAIIERFWKTIKEMLALKTHLSLCPNHLMERLNAGLLYYAALRPHQGLHGATPAEVYFGLTPACTAAVPPPRAADSQTASETRPDFDIAFVDADGRLPVLLRKAAA